PLRDRGSTRPLLPGPLLCDRALPANCPAPNGQAVFVGMAHSSQAGASCCPPWLALSCGNGPCPRNATTPTCKPCSWAWPTPTKPRREAVRPGWHYPVGTGHAREVQPHQRADCVRGLALSYGALLLTGCLRGQAMLKQAPPMSLRLICARPPCQ